MDPRKFKLISLELVKEALEKDISIPLKTFGLSMGDTIRSGEWVVVRKVGPEQLRFGDIVIFQNRAHFICHRLIKRKPIKNPDFVLTKGDSHIGPDWYIPANKILARVVGLKKDNHFYRLDGIKGRIINVLLGLYSLLVATLYKYLPFLKGFSKKRIDHAGMLIMWLIYTLVRLPAKIIRKIQR
jgi:signal peptidase I